MTRSEPIPWYNPAIDGEAWMTHLETTKLQELVQSRHQCTYLEIGTHHGHSLWSVKDFVATAHAIDHHAFPYPMQLDQQSNSRIMFYKAKAEKMAHIFKNHSLDVLFIDGNHRRVTLDFALYFTKVKKGGLIIFHDYNQQGFPWVTSLVDSLEHEFECNFLDSLAWFTKTHE